ncbi:MAG: hypothetical protein HY035_06135 [Nitrospirae bacterium]|nr:hypothetical protein [Nitrospirota bacterium]
MCQKMRGGVCDVVGIEPWYIECADKSLCHSNNPYEHCKLYIAEKLINYEFQRSILSNAR